MSSSSFKSLEKNEKCPSCDGGGGDEDDWVDGRCVVNISSN